MVTKEIPAVVRTAAPASEPLTSAVIKAHLDIASSETGHDVEITRLGVLSRELFEEDTQIITTNSTWTHTLSCFPGNAIQLIHRPISSISSVQYYDSNNQIQTVSAIDYSLDAARRKVRLGSSASWPTTYDRWDAVIITYVAGHGADDTSVPRLHQQMMLLICGHYYENTDMMAEPNKSHWSTAYESLLRRVMRSSYP